jgi:hypothetical protein
VQSQTDLFEIVLALRTASRFTSLLDGGEEECHEDRDDGDHNQQFNKSKRTTPHHKSPLAGPEGCFRLPGLPKRWCT